MDALIANAGQYGAVGMCLLACFWYINKKDTEYKDERIARDQILQQLHEKTLNSITENTKVTSELSTLIRNK